jgi:hypothetical protein
MKSCTMVSVRTISWSPKSTTAWRWRLGPPVGSCSMRKRLAAPPNGKAQTHRQHWTAGAFGCEKHGAASRDAQRNVVAHPSNPHCMSP